LIGDCDKPATVESTYKSPEEQIGWMPNSSSDLLTPNRRRKRKRAKSSSPSCPDTGSQSGGKSSMLLDKSTISAMKTPAADPAADLWQRYANGKKSSDGLLKLPEISSLLFQGSPRALETPVKGGGLRRWVSTGNDWPSSKTKKRCTNGRVSINVWQDQTAVESGGKSKVATMVQKIQESLASQRLEQDQDESPAIPMAVAHSSASPQSVNRVHSATDTPAESPSVQAQNILHRMDPPRALNPPRATEAKQKPYIPPMRMTQSGGVSAEPSGMMGDPLHPSSTRLHLQSKAPLPAFKRPTVTRPPSLPKVPQVVAPPKPPPISVELDDFDDAFDLTADDLDEILSQQPLDQRSLYDIPEYTGPPPETFIASQGSAEPPQKLQQATTFGGEDEFGDDDLDEESFVQAEFSATQAMKRVSQCSHEQAP
jgi:DNA replication ATP-dependent helicase Dna2